VMGYIEKGSAEGAELLMGGDRPTVGNGRGYFLNPTIFGAWRGR
jgi:acyl-CoA reductase-like NAD-dependent aldehyde dehydrogenase